MSKDSTLKKVEYDISQGDFGKARDRLHSLIGTYSDDLSLRSELACIYAKLQYPVMAGRYWYLEENQTDEIKAACERFEKSVNNDPFWILMLLKIRFNVDDISSDYAREKIKNLQRKCREKHGYSPVYSQKSNGEILPKVKVTLKQKFTDYLFIAFLIFVFGCVVKACIDVVIYILD
ncbi:MAG: hypothetical protein JXD22_09930 [Sedimentisphaerales bacterium]|nr:hypothetical protein [Sedimentisphaerales bacterium]